jgi:hypothetical protein
MNEELEKAEQAAKRAWPIVNSWVGSITALIGLFASLAGGVTWLVAHHRRAEETKQKMAYAQVQAQQRDYQASIQTDAEILKTDPLYEPALDQQLSTAMLWVENFEVSAPEGQSTAAPAAALLDQIMPILDAGLTRAKGTQAADVQAHIGWAHWLNQKIAEREFGPAAEQNLRAALIADPTNVYANAMLGNWMLQNNGNLADAMHHFDIAAATGNVRPYVRELELGGLRYLDKKGARAAQVKVANDMRKGGEPLDAEYKSRILSFCFNPTTTEHDELAESLSAAPPDDEWKTYLWINEGSDDPDDQQVQEFIHANLLEVNGDRGGALDQFRKLSQELKNSASTMIDPVNAAIARLSHS